MTVRHTSYPIFICSLHLEQGRVMAAPSRYIVGYFRSLHFSAWIVACMLCPVNYIGQWVPLVQMQDVVAGVTPHSIIVVIRFDY